MIENVIDRIKLYLRRMAEISSYALMHFHISAISPIQFSQEFMFQRDVILHDKSISA